MDKPNSILAIEAELKVESYRVNRSGTLWSCHGLTAHTPYESIEPIVNANGAALETIDYDVEDSFFFLVRLSDDY